MGMGHHLRDEPPLPRKPPPPTPPARIENDSSLRAEDHPCHMLGVRAEMIGNTLRTRSPPPPRQPPAPAPPAVIPKQPPLRQLSMLNDMTNNSPAHLPDVFVTEPNLTPPPTNLRLENVLANMLQERSVSQSVANMLQERSVSQSSALPAQPQPPPMLTNDQIPRLANMFNESSALSQQTSMSPRNRLCRIWYFDYFHLVPFRAQKIELWDNSQVNFIDSDGQVSGPHGRWRVDAFTNLSISFHYMGEGATDRRHLLMKQPAPNGASDRVLINTNGAHPVVMVYRGTEHRLCTVQVQ